MVFKNELCELNGMHRWSENDKFSHNVFFRPQMQCENVQLVNWIGFYCIFFGYIKWNSINANSLAVPTKCYFLCLTQSDWRFVVFYVSLFVYVYTVCMCNGKSSICDTKPHIVLPRNLFKRIMSAKFSKIQLFENDTKCIGNGWIEYK